MQQYLPFNPYMTAQQRLYQMEQQYPQLAQPQPVQPNSATVNNLVTIPVTNMEEANAFRVDLNGTPTFFYNAGKNEVYLKRTNTQTGLADFIVFGKVEQPKTEPKQNLSINTYEKDFKALNEKIDGLYSLFATVSQKSDKAEEESDKVSDLVSGAPLPVQINVNGTAVALLNKYSLTVLSNRVPRRSRGAYVVPEGGTPYVILFDTPCCKCNAQ